MPAGTTRLQSVGIKPQGKSDPRAGVPGVHYTEKLPVIRFGESKDGLSYSESLPAWAEAVKSPPINRLKIIKDFQQYVEKVQSDYEKKKKANPKSA